MLKAADTLAETGDLSEAEVAPIRPGRGKRDAAEDAVQLAALFRRHKDAIAGKHPITKADIDQADQLGSRLLSLVQPQGAVREKKLPAKVQEDIDLRDRFWTLLYRRYEDVWRVGAVVWGWAVDEHVPSLLARAGGKRAGTEPKAGVEAKAGVDPKAGVEPKAGVKVDGGGEGEKK